MKVSMIAPPWKDLGCQVDDKPPLEIYREAVGRLVGTWICMTSVFQSSPCNI